MIKLGSYILNSDYGATMQIHDTGYCMKQNLMMELIPQIDQGLLEITCTAATYIVNLA